MAMARTVKNGKLGKHDMRLVLKEANYYGLIDGRQCVQGTDPEEVWRRLHDEARKADPRYFGFDGARARFLHFFPGGFRSEAYLDADGERHYKVAAKEKLDASLPLQGVGERSGLGADALAVFTATNLLSPFERMRVTDVLRGPSADAFLRAASGFATAPSPTSLRAVEVVLRPHECAKWLVVTYLPFLWVPERHMLLKPAVTKDFAARVGHPFADCYEPRLDFEVYRSLLDLTEKTRTELADMEPRDNIDIQSFIWTVGKYEESDRRV